MKDSSGSSRISPVITCRETEHKLLMRADRELDCVLMSVWVLYGFSGFLPQFSSNVCV